MFSLSPLVPEKKRLTYVQPSAFQKRSSYALTINNLGGKGVEEENFIKFMVSSKF